MLRYIRQRLPYFKTTLFYFGATIFSAALGVAINPVLARNLTHEDYSLIGYFASFQILLTPFVGLSLNSFLFKKFHSLKSDDRLVLINTLYFSTVFIGLLSVVVFSSLMFLYLSYKGVNMRFFPVALFAFFQTYFAVLLNLYLATLRLKKLAARYAMVVVVGAIINLVITYCFVVELKFGADGKFGAAMLASLFCALWAFFGICKKVKFDFRFLEEGIRFGIPLTLSGGFWYVLVGLDKSLLVKLHDSYTYGNYVVAGQVAGYFAIFYTSINNVCESDIFMYAGRRDYRNLIRVVSIVLGFVAMVNTFLFIFAREIVGVLTGGAYVNAYGFAKIFAIQNISMAFYYVVVQLLVAFGLVKEELLVRVIGVALTVPLLYCAIDFFGFEGAAWSQVGGFFILMLLGLLVIRLRHFSVGK